MEVNGSKTLGRDALRTSKVRRILRARALQWAPAVAAATNVSSRGGYFSGERTPPGETRRSVHVESVHRANDGRPAARIVVRGAAVPLNWRFERGYIVRALAGRP